MTELILSIIALIVSLSLLFAHFSKTNDTVSFDFDTQKYYQGGKEINREYFSQDNDYFFRTTDSGKTWERIKKESQ